ncbi:heterotrimeric G-protein alpha subunit, GPA3-like protein [Syncephalastrum racemosum]|uniref:Heterotrimeric G-protein alpha subunit, GPA3-like protein n=1 Tax=Syncephalastrum racemosum TaxID=13706 RepID=A0A1X2HA26_SYNRA|nr:heterotrimeric G-protein alpha subunit, GPA3-like protein [Syncephalastrum racemosum]
MGLCWSSEARAERNRSEDIDRMLEEDSRKLKRECKILLLGSGESGKSTIVKQMKIIHQNGYSKQELESWRPAVYNNLMESVQDIINGLKRYDISFENEKNEYHAHRVAEYRPSEGNMSSDLAAAAYSIWKDPAVARLLEMESSDFYLMDSAPYFFEESKRIGQENYVPTVQDVLYARLKTTGITDTRFRMGQINVHMFDVGGQRSERKKWIHCFEAVTSIIFCVSLSEYDQVLLEENRQNRMMESLVLFESVINSRWFLRTSTILFLNKIDVFKAKLPKIPLERYFPDYGGGNDVAKAAKYILWRFNQTNRAKLNIYPHLTQATDTKNIKLVFTAIKETILQNALKDSGIL